MRQGIYGQIWELQKAIVWQYILSCNLVRRVYNFPWFSPSTYPPSFSYPLPFNPTPLPPSRCSKLDTWIVPVFCSGLSPCGALKTGRCSGLEPLIIPTFCSGLSLRRALNTRKCSGLDRCIAPQRAFKMERSSNSDQHFLFNFVTQYYQALWESVSPVCGNIAIVMVTSCIPPRLGDIGR